MKILSHDRKYDAPIVIALGFFDCVHKGHAVIINRAKELAHEYGAQCAVFTFSNDPCAFLGKKPQLYTLEERVSVFEDLGVDVTVCAEFTEPFINLSAEQFLDALNGNFNLKAVVAGTDYSFGANKSGNSEFLQKYFAEKGVKVEIMRFLLSESGKISSTDIKKSIENGDIEAANDCLSEPYFMLGTIVHAHNRGTKIGYPTANLQPSQEKLRIKEGVYITALTVDGKTFRGGTNVGAKPTFEDSVFSVETYLTDFEGDLYGKTVKLAFYKRIREISKFSSPEGLQEQLKKDTATINSFFDNAQKAENKNK